MNTGVLVKLRVFDADESTKTVRTSNGELIRFDFYKNTVVTTNYNIADECYSFVFERGIFKNSELVEGYLFHVLEYNAQDESDFECSDSELDYNDCEQGYSVSKILVRDSVETSIQDDLVFDQKKNCAYSKCNLPFSRMKCARCGVYYHSRTCQRADWATHKVHCRNTPLSN